MENDILIERALENTPLNERSDIPKGGMEDFLMQLSENYVKERIKEFGSLCEDARITNIQHMKQLEQAGNKTPTRMIGGKVYDGSSGWSKDLSFKHKWVIPNKLRFFMRNLVYVNFWDDSNAKVRDKFMKDVIKGVDPYELLKTLRVYYGSNPGGSNNKESLKRDINRKYNFS